MADIDDRAVLGALPTGLSRPAAHAWLQLIVLLWGCTAILGRLITISALPLVWYRLVFVVAALAVVAPMRGHSFRIPRRHVIQYALVGAIIGIHWLCFYGAIKQAGISTAVLTLSTVAFFTAIVEPIVFRRAVAVSELVIGAIVVGGVSLLLQLELRVDALGLALGLGSALLAATFGVMNGKLAQRKEPPERLMFYELAGALVTVSACFAVAPSTFIAPWDLAPSDIGWLAVLAVFCTVLPQVWAIYVLRVLSPFTMAVTLNLEPVYALILSAIVFTDEHAPSWRFYLGAGVLMALVIINALRRTARDRAE
ncbi:MAG TPA: DMT family transporter [Kofleriaceae bacterium]